jgi:hypothetical protein
MTASLKRRDKEPKQYKKSFHGSGLMLDLIKDVQSLTTLRCRSVDFMKQLNKEQATCDAHSEGEGCARRAGRG